MANGLYCPTFLNALKNDLNVDLDNGDFYCLLTTSSYTPNFETDAFLDDGTIISNEVSGTNYTQGGNALSSITFAKSSDGSGKLTWDAGDVTWPNSTISNARRAVIYDRISGSAANSARYLVACIDFGGNFSTTSGTFEIQWNASGIFTLDLVP